MRTKQQGFTMIEILLVVIIISVLAAMIVPNFVGKGQKARLSAAKADIESNLTLALDMYELENGTYPSTEQGLKALVVKPQSSPVPEDWSGPYLKKKKIPTDPWGREYQYSAPGVKNPESYDLFSFGPDGVESDDDITNWYEIE